MKEDDLVPWLELTGDVADGLQECRAGSSRDTDAPKMTIKVVPLQEAPVNGNNLGNILLNGSRDADSTFSGSEATLVTFPSGYLPKSEETSEGELSDDVEAPWEFDCDFKRNSLWRVSGQEETFTAPVAMSIDDGPYGDDFLGTETDTYLNSYTKILMRAQANARFVGSTTEPKEEDSLTTWEGRPFQFMSVTDHGKVQGGALIGAQSVSFTTDDLVTQSQALLLLLGAVVSFTLEIAVVLVGVLWIMLLTFVARKLPSQ